MPVIDVHSRDEFLNAMTSVHAGDTIQMAAGDYGDVVIRNKNFASEITITSADPTHAATFHSLNLLSSSGIDFKGINVTMTPTTSTVAWSAAVKMTDSSNISFIGGAVTGGKAITGVDPTATKLDGTGNVIGMDTGHGIDMAGSSHNILIQGVEISHFMKGIGVGGSDVTIRGNSIHDLRTSAIVGSISGGLTIDGNKISDETPWAWGSGDHADFIHIWTDTARQTGATHDVAITNNLMNQGAGVATLGIYLDDNSNDLGFTNVKIEGNVILNGNGQAMRLENVSHAVVDSNTMLQTSGTTKDAPGILVLDGSHDINVFHNQASYVLNYNHKDPSTPNIHDNTIIQISNPSAAGYYGADLINHVQAMGTTSGVFDYVAQHLGGIAGTSTALPIDSTAPVVTMPVDFSFFGSSFTGGVML